MALNSDDLATASACLDRIAVRCVMYLCLCCASGSRWDTVQVFAPDIEVAAKMGRSESGQPFWKRLAYVAITRAERELRWVVRNRLARPSEPLGVDDLHMPAAELKLTVQSDED